MPHHRGNATELPCTECGGVFPVEQLKRRRKCAVCRSNIRKAAYRRTSPVKRRAIQQRYRDKNRDKVRAAGRKFYREHREERLSRNLHRRSKIKTFEEFRRSEIFARDGGRCWYCRIELTESNWHLDHVVPIARGGPHIKGNVVVSCVSCNTKKGVKAPTRPWRAPVRFWFQRNEDVSGVSGTGYVAEGVIFCSGKVVLCWLGELSSVNVYESLDECIAIHGHDGATQIVWEE